MRSVKKNFPAAAALLFSCLAATVPLAAQSRGLEAIRAADMKVHLDFLAAPEFGGRPAPSAALEIASLYLAREAAARGLKPLLPDGSFFQRIPIEMSALSPARSRLRVLTPGGELQLFHPHAFTVNMRTAAEGVVSGGLVFLGAAADVNEKTLEPLDLEGKFAVVLGDSPDPFVPPAPGAPAPFSLIAGLWGKGARGIVRVIAPGREKTLAERGGRFDPAERPRFPSIDMSGRRPPSTVTPPPFLQIEVRPEAGAALLGLGPDGLEAKFAEAAAGRPQAAGPVEGRTLEASVVFDNRTEYASNVVGWIEGTDPVLKGEYVAVTGHQDHLFPRDGAVLPGADDNGSGAVAMLELIEALMIERPKRSVIFAWTTAEEWSLVGACHFVQHCPVPVGKISANLNLDMLSRNDPGMIHFIGSAALSTEFDRILRAANDRSVRLRIDETYQSPRHPDRFFFRSDQFPFIQYGVPGVWIFCGTTPDYHTPRDTVARVDYAKMETVTKFAYVACLDVGNAPSLMKLDVQPDVTTRGAHNMKVAWYER